MGGVRDGAHGAHGAATWFVETGHQHWHLALYVSSSGGYRQLQTTEAVVVGGRESLSAVTVSMSQHAVGLSSWLAALCLPHC